MKLAFFIPDLAGGGAQRMIVNMANEFASRGHEVDLVLVKNQGEYQNLLSKEVNIVDLDKPRALFALPALAAYLRENQPDALLSALFYVNVIAVLAKFLAPKAKTKIIISERNHLSVKAQYGESWPDRAAPWIVRLIYPFADAVVGISQGVMQDIQKNANIRPNRISWIHNPVVTKGLLENLKETSKDEWFEQAKSQIIVMSGRLVHQKDYVTAVCAYEKIVQKRDIRLLILGEGALRGELEALAEQLGVEDKIHFTGFVENPLSYMKHADLFVLSSIHEGFGNVVVEALLCGLPVVSTDCPSGPAEILQDGEFGTLVPVCDPQALSDAIISALDKECDPEKQKARAMDFTVENICSQYEGLFNKVIGGEK